MKDGDGRDSLVVCLTAAGCADQLLQDHPLHGWEPVCNRPQRGSCGVVALTPMWLCRQRHQAGHELQLAL